MIRRVAGAVALALSLLAASCASNAQNLAPGEVAYSPGSGVLAAVEKASYEESVRAAKKGMESLRLKPFVRKEDGFETLVLGETTMGEIAQSHEVRVRVLREGESTTRLELRIVGRRDEDRLRAIYDSIRAAY
jgi:hypothetical protein